MTCQGFRTARWLVAFEGLPRSDSQIRGTQILKKNRTNDVMSKWIIFPYYSRLTYIEMLIVAKMMDSIGKEWNFPLEDLYPGKY